MVTAWASSVLFQSLGLQATERWKAPLIFQGRWNLPFLGVPKGLAGRASGQAEPKGRRWGKILFLKAGSHLPSLRLEQSWENGTGVPNQETALFTQLSRAALRERKSCYRENLKFPIER